MTYSAQVEHMCPIAKGPKHGPAPIPEEGEWVKAYKIEDISGYTHGVGWCAPQQGTCKLSLNIKNGIIEEALVETIGCSGMTHSAAMAGEILPGKTILEALNTDLVCDAINVAMRELFLQIVYGRSQTAFSEDGLPIGAGLDDLGKGLRSMTGTIFSTKAKGVRYLELTEGYILKTALDKDNQVIGYQFVRMGIPLSCRSQFRESAVFPEPFHLVRIRVPAGIFHIPLFFQVTACIHQMRRYKKCLFSSHESLVFYGLDFDDLPTRQKQTFIYIFTDLYLNIKS